MGVRTTGRRTITAILTGIVVTGGTLFATAVPAHAATTATFLASSGVLSVFGDNAANTMIISRDVGGRLLVNAGAVPISGGTPSVANTELIQIFGLGGNDILTVSEVGGALPRASLFGGADADTLTGGSGADMVFGQSGNDVLLGKGGRDTVFGGTEQDVLAGGDADDQVFGEAGNDQTTWANGDDTDLNEGGEGTDTVVVTGGSGAEDFTATANGVRTLLKRSGTSPFSIDIGTTEFLSVNTGNGQDRFDASGILTPTLGIAVDTGAENDAVLGSGGDDLIVTGDGTDAVVGRAGDDQVFLGGGDDLLTWRPGDGNDFVVGNDGFDHLNFTGSSADERVGLVGTGDLLRISRNVDGVVLELNDLEGLELNASGGADQIALQDLSGTDLSDILLDLDIPSTGLPDGRQDTVGVQGTAGDDTIRVAGSGLQEVSGIGPRLRVLNADSAPVDRISISAGAGNDLVDASQLAAPAGVVVEAGDGNDVVIGSDGDDALSGGDGNDALVGRAGTDTLNGGPGDDVLIGGEIVTDGVIPTRAWLARHARTVAGDSVFDLDGTRLVVPGIPLDALQ